MWYYEVFYCKQKINLLELCNTILYIQAATLYPSTNTVNRIATLAKILPNIAKTKIVMRVNYLCVIIALCWSCQVELFLF